MSCELIHEKIADLFDDTLTAQEREDLMAHIKTCDDCGWHFREVSELAAGIRVNSQLIASREFRKRILEKIREESSAGKIKWYEPRRIAPAPGSAPEWQGIYPGRLTRGTAGHSFPWKKAFRIAASVMLLAAVALTVVLITSRNPAQAAGKLIDRSILAMTEMKSVQMNFRIRTEGKEDFDFVDPSGGFLECRLWKTFGDPPRWRMEKDGRTVIMDGKNQYLVIAGSGFTLKGGPRCGFVEWMRIFLDPVKLLESEKEFACAHHAFCKIEEKGGHIILIVKAKALGNFQNSFALNNSVQESNNTRVYTFNKTTMLPESIEITIESGQHSIPVIELDSIAYNLALPDSLLRFKPIRGFPVISLEALDSINRGGISNVNSGQATRMFFEAISKHDNVQLNRLYPLAGLAGGSSFADVQKRYSGLEILWLGKPFKSGLYIGDFVPYMIRLKSGDTVRGTLSLRRDNPSHVWNIDGGF